MTSPRGTEIEQQIDRLAAQQATNPVETELEAQRLANTLIADMNEGATAWANEYIRPLLQLARRLRLDLPDEILHSVGESVRRALEDLDHERRTHLMSPTSRSATRGARPRAVGRALVSVRGIDARSEIVGDARCVRLSSRCHGPRSRALTCPDAYAFGLRVTRYSR